MNLLEDKIAIILAGGLGTRLRPLTDTTPKPLLPINGKPMMQYAIENLAKQGIKEIILGISYHAEKIMDYFGDGSKLGIKINYSIEKEPLGTGGAIKQAVNSYNLKKEFILAWGDNLMDIDYRKMHEIYENNNAKLVIALTKREDVENFGVAKLENQKIITFIEKPARDKAPSNLINAGAFIMDPLILDMLPEGKSSIERDCFEKLTKEGKVYAYSHSGYWYPTDTLEKYQFAKNEMKRN